ncbi:hypothetical protein DMC64_41675 [Amycolatopsis sp. WAC 04197]|uniref:hypothetical protein n=1 Tax=Amycolatopsis sp. WAC 04197 TaxID=2203199 RepID=UPI000F76C9D9|nr:hypothetical protein [Amycolatopsis sp. WAC 04197]RSN38580.1 hypothetical protein DMC64_41675 [Amycolatopsis sp. WAC 04197]
MGASKEQRAATAKRRADAIRLRLAGMDYETIAERLEYSSRQAAHKDIQRAMTAYIQEASAAVDELRNVELMRLDRLQAAAWPAAVKGDLLAIETCRRLIVERRKLLGLDRPAKVEVITLDAVDEEIRKLEAELAGGVENPAPDPFAGAES